MTDTKSDMPFAVQFYITHYNMANGVIVTEELGMYRDFFGAAVGVFTWSLMQENAKDLFILDVGTKWRPEEH